MRVHRLAAILRSCWACTSRLGQHCAQGCTLFVKLLQFDKADAERVEIDPAAGDVAASLRRARDPALIISAASRTAFWSSWTRCRSLLSRMIHPDGEEVVVLAGSCADAQGTYSTAGDGTDPRWPASPRIFLKRRHVRFS